MTPIVHYFRSAKNQLLPKKFLIKFELNWTRRFKIEAKKYTYFAENGTMVLLLVALFQDPESFSKEICFRAILESSREGAHQTVSKVGAWICCFMLDTSLRQTPNAKRQTKNSNSRPRRSHCKFFKKKKDFSFLRR